MTEFYSIENDNHLKQAKKIIKIEKKKNKVQNTFTDCRVSESCRNLGANDISKVLSKVSNPVISIIPCSENDNNGEPYLIKTRPSRLSRNLNENNFSQKLAGKSLNFSHELFASKLKKKLNKNVKFRSKSTIISQCFNPTISIPPMTKEIQSSININPQHVKISPLVKTISEYIFPYTSSEEDEEVKHCGTNPITSETALNDDDNFSISETSKKQFSKIKPARGKQVNRPIGLASSTEYDSDKDVIEHWHITDNDKQMSEIPFNSANDFMLDKFSKRLEERLRTVLDNMTFFQSSSTMMKFPEYPETLPDELFQNEHENNSISNTEDFRNQIQPSVMSRKIDYTKNRNELDNQSSYDSNAEVKCYNNKYSQTMPFSECNSFNANVISIDRNRTRIIDCTKIQNDLDNRNSKTAVKFYNNNKHTQTVPLSVDNSDINMGIFVDRYISRIVDCTKNQNEVDHHNSYDLKAEVKYYDKYSQTVPFYEDNYYSNRVISVDENVGQNTEMENSIFTTAIKNVNSTAKFPLPLSSLENKDKINGSSISLIQNNIHLLKSKIPMEVVDLNPLSNSVCESSVAGKSNEHKELDIALCQMDIKFNEDENILCQIPKDINCIQIVHSEDKEEVSNVPLFEQPNKTEYSNLTLGISVDNLCNQNPLKTSKSADEINSHSYENCDSDVLKNPGQENATFIDHETVSLNKTEDLISFPSSEAAYSVANDSNNEISSREILHRTFEIADLTISDGELDFEASITSDMLPVGHIAIKVTPKDASMLDLLPSISVDINTFKPSQFTRETQTEFTNGGHFIRNEEVESEFSQNANLTRDIDDTVSSGEIVMESAKMMPHSCTKEMANLQKENLILRNKLSCFTGRFCLGFVRDQG